MIMPAHFRYDMARGIRLAINRNFTDAKSVQLVAGLVVSHDKMNGIRWTMSLTCVFPGRGRLYGHLRQGYPQPKLDS